MFFSRRPKDGSETAIEAFWSWWATARPRAENMVDGTPDEALIGEISRLVTAIHPDLEWEFTAGLTTRHLLVVTAAGDAGLRSLAERWRRAGPEPDPTFGYAAARQGSPSALEATLEINEHRLDLAELRFSAVVDEDTAGVDVRVWHPAFAAVPEDARVQVAFLALDWLLGEDIVEIWIGGIAPVTELGPASTGSPFPAEFGASPTADSPFPAGTGASLTAAQLAELVAAQIPADGEEHWATMAGTRHGKPILARAQAPLKAARWPGHDLHVRVEVPYRARDENGFPTEAALHQLHALEDHIQAHSDGAVVVAHETSDGIRTTHLYADRPAAAHALEPLLAAWPDGRVKLRITPDARWNEVRHLTSG